MAALEQHNKIYTATELFVLFFYVGDRCWHSPMFKLVVISEQQNK